jgi:type IV pilus assembly protein PilF
MKALALSTLLAAATLAGCITTGGRDVDQNSAAATNVQLGVEYMRKGDLAMAKEKLERADKQNPNSPDGNFALAELYSRLQRKDDADRRYREAINLAPDKLEIVNGYAAFLCGSGDVDKGIAQFEKLIQNPLYGRQPAAATNAGMCLRNQKRHADSIRYFETALAKQPDWLDAVVQLADVQINLGKPEAARRAVDNYLSMRGSAAVLVIGARAAVAQGDCSGAQTYTARLRSDYPNSRETLVLLPQVLGACARSTSL